MLTPHRLLLTGSLCLIFPAFAKSGAYLAANLGYANIQEWWSAAPALTLNAGYNYNEYLASEAGITWINSITTQQPGSGGYTQSQSFADLAAKGSLPLSNIFNAYLKGGFGIGYASSSIGVSPINTPYNWNSASNGISLGIYMALGGEFKLSSHFDLTVEDYGIIPLSGNNWGNVNILGLGTKYNF